MSLLDRRVKFDIQHYEADDDRTARIVEGLRQIRPCTFKYKKSEDTSFGVIAQECMKHGLYELIYLNESKGLEAVEGFDVRDHELAVDYQKVGVMLIPYVQFLERRI